MSIRKIASISLISSTTCNLNCSFCYLHKNKSYKEFDKLVRAAWQDGTYLDNAYKTVSKFCDPSDVEICQLWGGETLLHIEDVTQNIPKLYKCFPGIKNWKFSTNWLIDINKFFDFIVELDKNVNHPTRIDLQLSIDGPPGPFCDEGHHGNWEVYRRNMKNFTTLINNKKLNNVHIAFQINATANKTLFMEKMSNYEEMKNYVQYMKDFLTEIEEMCISKSLSLTSTGIFPGYAIPSTDSKADGQKFANICKLWEEVRQNEFPEWEPGFGFYYGTGEINADKCLLSQNFECGELKTSLTINYDGSICECSGSFIDNFEPYLNELLEEGNLDAYRTAQLRNKLVYNPGQSSPSELEKKEWYIHTGYKNNYSTYICLLLAVADELLASKQIDPIYHDRELLFNHLNAIAAINSCTRENLRDNKVPYLISAGILRRYLNGVAELAYNAKRRDHIKNREKMIFGGREYND